MFFSLSASASYSAFSTSILTLPSPPLCTQAEACRFKFVDFYFYNLSHENPRGAESRGQRTTSKSIPTQLIRPQEPPFLRSLLLLHILYSLYAYVFTNMNFGLFIHAIKSPNLLFCLFVFSPRCVWCDASGLAQGKQLQNNVDTKKEAE